MTFPLFAFLCSTIAAAGVYGGNPHLSLTIGDGGAITGGVAELEEVVLHRCGGGHTVLPADQSIDPTTGWGEDIDAGCYTGLSAVWVGEVTMTGDGFEISYDRVSTHIDLTGASQSVALEPISVTSGSYAGAPMMTVTIQ